MQHGSSLTSPVPKEYLTDREKRVLRAIQGDPEARKSFEFLARKIGLSTELLTIYFVQEAWGPLAVADEAFGNYEQWQKMESLARRLKGLAGRIKDANQLPNWHFTVPRVDLVDRGHDRVQAAFKELPELLLLYARNMRIKVQIIRAFQRLSRARKALELEFAEGLINWIEKSTGRRYRDRVAAVQRVTYREAGRTLLPASGETLRKRDFRKRKRLSSQAS